MTFRGNIGRVIPDCPVIHARSGLTISAQPGGNGPILNVAPFAAAAGAIVTVDEPRAARIYTAFADATGIWRFYDIGPGTYVAREIGASRQWQIVVAADLSFTVTPFTASFPQDVSSISIG